jgi:hypothetical protein
MPVMAALVALTAAATEQVWEPVMWMMVAGTLTISNSPRFL